MVLVYSEPLCRRYYASRFSLAYLTFALVGLVAVVLPFFLAYSNTPSFWLKTNTYREQPAIEFEHKLVVLMHGVSRAGPFQLFYSTLSSLNAASGDVRVPLIRSTRLDTNRDGVADRFRTELTMPLVEGESVLGASVLALYNAKLKYRARLEFEAAAYAEKQSALPGSALYVAGDFTFNQRWPLKPKGGYWVPYEDEPLLSPSLEFGSLPNLLASYQARNYTCDLEKRYEVWSPTLGAASNQAEDYAFNLTLDLNVPVADVLYTPTATEVLKAAWVRYLSLAVIVYYLLEKLCFFVFYFRLVDTTMCVEVPDSKAKQPGF